MILAIIHEGQARRAEDPVRSRLTHGAIDRGVIGQVEMIEPWHGVLGVGAVGLVPARAQHVEQGGSDLTGSSDDEGAHQQRETRTEGASESMLFRPYRTLAGRATEVYTRPP